MTVTRVWWTRKVGTGQHREWGEGGDVKNNKIICSCVCLSDLYGRRTHLHAPVCPSIYPAHMHTPPVNQPLQLTRAVGVFSHCNCLIIHPVWPLTATEAPPCGHQQQHRTCGNCVMCLHGQHSSVNTQKNRSGAAGRQRQGGHTQQQPSASSNKPTLNWCFRQRLMPPCVWFYRSP